MGTAICMVVTDMCGATNFPAGNTPLIYPLRTLFITCIVILRPVP
jgi:hypothetical protein